MELKFEYPACGQHICATRAQIGVSNMPKHLYEVRPRKDHRDVNLVSDGLPLGALWYGNPDAAANAISYAKFYSRSHDAVIRVYDAAGNVI